MENKPYISPAGRQFPVIACSPWVSRVDGVWQPSTVDDFRWLRRCGFNVAMISIKDLGKLKEAIRNAGTAGVRCILQQYTNMSNAEMERYVSEVRNYSNLSGYALKDEPKFSLIKGPDEDPGNPTEGECYRMYHNIYQTLDPGKIVLMNLLYVLDMKTETAKDYVDNYETYIDYLKYIQEQYGPPLWSYDVYPIKTKVTTFYADAERFYSAFRDFRRISDLSGRPFWAYCMSVGYVNWHKKEGGGSGVVGYTRMAPTKGNLRYEAFSALAYGAQAIVYWNYCQTTDSHGEEYITAPVNRKGERTDVWYNARAVNSEIARYSEVFLGCRVIDVLSPSEQKSETTRHIGPVVEITSTAGVTVSHLRNNGYDYAVVVSADPFRSQGCVIRYMPDYLENYEVVELSPNFLGLGTLHAPSSAALTKPIVLASGGYAIIRWKQR